MDQFSLCTFNVLAPCYKETDNGDEESHQPKVWRARHLQIVKFLLEITPRPTVLVLQEFWSDSDFQALYTHPVRTIS